MANFFSQLFGFANPKPNLNQAPPLQADVVGAADLRQSLENRGIGYGPTYVNKSTSPFIAQRQANWDLAERPALEESYASRGLGRSSIAGRDIGQAFAQKERDVNQMIAEAQLKDLEQGKLDVENRDTMLFNLGNVETQQRNLAQNDEQARRLNNIAFDQAREAQNQQATQLATGTGLNLIGGLTGLASPELGAVISGVGNQFSGSGLPEKSDISIIKDILSGGTRSPAFTKKVQTAPSGGGAGQALRDLNLLG